MLFAFGRAEQSFLLTLLDGPILPPTGRLPVPGFGACGGANPFHATKSLLVWKAKPSQIFIGGFRTCSLRQAKNQPNEAVLQRALVAGSSRGRARAAGCGCREDTGREVRPTSLYVEGMIVQNQQTRRAI